MKKGASDVRYDTERRPIIQEPKDLLRCRKVHQDVVVGGVVYHAGGCSASGMARMLCDRDVVPYITWSVWYHEPKRDQIPTGRRQFTVLFAVRGWKIVPLLAGWGDEWKVTQQGGEVSGQGPDAAAADGSE